MVSLVQKYLEISHYSSQKIEFEDLFKSHPNYPSLFAVTDTLDLLSIVNMAVKVPKEQFVELPDSFLAICNKNLVLVDKSSAEISIVTEKGEQKKLTYNEFIADWNGVIIAIEPNASISKENSKVDIRVLKFIAPIVALVVLSVFYNKYTIYDFALLVTSLVGLLFSIFIIQEKFGVSNQAMSKFCNISTSASCDSVIKSDVGAITKWLSFSDLPLVFFGVNLFSVLLQPSSSSIFAGFLSLLSLPLIVYSVWIQKMQVKKWCLLCLMIAFIVLVQGLLWIFMTQPLIETEFAVPQNYLFSLIAISFLWFLSKPVIENKIAVDKSVNELVKFKRNYLIFNFLLKNIPLISGFNLLKGLRFGKSNAPIHLTLILSPSCGHCHKAFSDAYTLVKKCPEKIFLTILFNVNPKNNDNPYKIVVERLLTINDADQEKMQEAISDWHIGQIGIEAWKSKWNNEPVCLKVNDEIQRQYDWCEKNKFNHTPVKLINDKIFPDEYEISELKYFLTDFTEKEPAELSENVA